MQRSPSAWKPCSQTSGQTRDDLQLDRIERIDAGDLGIELGAGVAVELRQRALRGAVPVAIGIAGQAADAAQFGLHRLGDVGLRRPRGEGGDVHRLVLVGRSRRRRLVGGGAFGGDALLFGRGGLVLRHLLGLFGRDARLLGGLGFGLGLGLLRLLGALGGEPCPLLFGQPRFFGRRDARFLGGDLVELKLGKAGVEAIGILREEGVERALVADLQREFVIAAGFGLRAEGRRRWRRRLTGAGTSGTSSPPSEPYTKGSCLLPVVLSTSSRTKPNARRTSSPGLVR